MTPDPALPDSDLPDADLTDARIDAARQRGDHALWLEVRPSNLPARALYQRAGFVEVGCRRDYYPTDQPQREDALVLRLGLDAEGCGLGERGQDALV